MTPEQQKTLSNEQSIMREQLIEVWGEKKTDALIFSEISVHILVEEIAEIRDSICFHTLAEVFNFLKDIVEEYLDEFVTITDRGQEERIRLEDSIKKEDAISLLNEWNSSTFSEQNEHWFHYNKVIIKPWKAEKE